MDAAVKAIKKTSPGVNPYAVASAQLQKSKELKPGTNKATPLGAKRGAMSRTQRHKNPL